MQKIRWRMVIYLSGDVEPEVNLDELTPKQIVTELNKYVVGQNAAKRAVAVALRNRIRRQKLPPDLAQDVMPKNIIMIGSTGIGKTEIARRLARLDRKSTRLNSSHVAISYAVFCLKKKKKALSANKT